MNLDSRRKCEVHSSKMKKMNSLCHHKLMIGDGTLEIIAFSALLLGMLSFICRYVNII